MPNQAAKLVGMQKDAANDWHERWARLNQRVEQACAACGRDRRSVSVLAVSKTHSADSVRQAHAVGLSAFGENYVQEALAKIESLRDLREQLQWHFIGPLQSNKTRAVAEAFDWVHSVDRLKIAQRLSQQRPIGLAALNVCLQVNISAESSKSGMLPQDVLEVAQAVASMPGLRLRGLMAIPQPEHDPQAQREPHRRLRALWQEVREAGVELDTLSMGMSDDLEAAIAEGSTLVRVGTALFGPRQRHDHA